MPAELPAISYEQWAATCDTLHAHTQVLGKLAVELAPQQRELQHAALRITPRGWETDPLPAPDESGLLLATLDLRTHESVVEHSDGREVRIALTPNRPVGEVTRELLEAVGRLGGPVTINAKPQEVTWTQPLNEDTEHATYDPDQVATYFTAATQAAMVLTEFRAPFSGRSSPVNAWWGTFDMAVHFFSGKPSQPPADDFISRNGGDAEQIELGWWPGDARHDGAAFFAFAFPTPDEYSQGELEPDAAHWDSELGEFILDWDDIRSEPDPHALGLEFCRSAFEHSSEICEWDPVLAESALGVPPPVH
jgi:hypothetical protein